ncbi:hypothetical protein T492DRAFT_876632 [Pavlovales sp. CCMP2436]|nr:hypothetical protein T492DRAFT_876632 [Pavlovales sp. CCMP2436]
MRAVPPSLASLTQPGVEVTPYGIALAVLVRAYQAGELGFPVDAAGAPSIAHELPPVAGGRAGAIAAAALAHASGTPAVTEARYALSPAGRRALGGLLAQLCASPATGGGGAVGACAGALAGALREPPLSALLEAIDGVLPHECIAPRALSIGEAAAAAAAAAGPGSGRGVLGGGPPPARPLPVVPLAEGAAVRAAPSAQHGRSSVRAHVLHRLSALGSPDELLDAIDAAALLLCSGIERAAGAARLGGELNV